MSVAIHDVPSRCDKRKEEEEAVVVVIMRYGDLTDSLKENLIFVVIVKSEKHGLSGDLRGIVRKLGWAIDKKYYLYF